MDLRGESADEGEERLLGRLEVAISLQVDIDAIEPDLTLRGIWYAWDRIRAAAAQAAAEAAEATSEQGAST